jgi:glycosyl hydrolase family 113
MGITFPRVPLEETLGDLQKMRAAGINTVTVDVWENVDSSTSTRIHPDDTEHNITLSPEQLQSAIRRAKEANMRVYFMPKLWCPKCTHTWRGILQPSPRETFYENYNAFLAKYADIAKRAGVDVFVIGSEMNSTQTDPQWREVAQKAKAAFGGPISYVANWDTVRVPADPNFVIGFWDLVDELGISAYYPLVDDERPTVSQIREGWHSSSHRQRWKGNDWVAGLQDLATKYPGKKVVFGEVGYLSATYAGIEPYNPACCGRGADANGVTSQADMAVQTNFYQALLETFQAQPWWGGVVWWEWYKVGDKAPDQSMSYTPRDKTTEKFLKAWYVDGWRGGDFSATQPVTTTTTPGSTTTTPGSPPGSSTTTTTQPGMSPAPYRPPPPNSAPLPMQPGPSSPPSTAPPTNTPPANGPPSNPPPNGSPPPNQQAPSSAPPGLSPEQPPPAAPPAYIPNSAPVIGAQETTARTPRPTTTTVPPTTTTTAARGPAPAWPDTAAGPPPTPPVLKGAPVVARSLGTGGAQPSRARAIALAGVAIFGPILLGIACLMVNAVEDRRRAVFAAAPALAWRNTVPRAPGVSAGFDVGPERPRPPSSGTPSRAAVPRPAARSTAARRERPFPGVSRSGMWGSRRSTWPQPQPRRRRPGPRWPDGRR